MQSLKERLARDRLRSPEHKGVLRFVKRKLKPRKYIPNRYYGIFVNRYCNLKCFSCGALGMNPSPDETTLDEIALFLDRIRGSYPDSTVMITGGEPTMIRPKKLGAVCKLIHDNGFKVGLLTNGYKFFPVEWFDYVMLDNHGVNTKELALWERALKENNHWFETVSKTYHKDTWASMQGNITKGLRCANFLKPILLWKAVVYPCCNIMCVEWWHKSDEVTEALKKAGWHIGNENLLETMKNWRETLPSSFYRYCSIKCWKDSRVAKWKKISLK